MGRADFVGCALVLVSALASASGQALLKITSERSGMPPTQLALYRVLCQGLFCAGGMLARRVPLLPQERRDIWVFVAGRGFFGGLAMLLGIGAIMLLPIGDAQALSDLYPIGAAVMARVWLKEPLQAMLPVALVLSVSGSMLISQPEFLFRREPGASPCSAVALGAGVQLCSRTVGYIAAVLTSLAMAMCYPLVRKATAAHTLQLVASLTLFQSLWTAVYVVWSSERFLPVSQLALPDLALTGLMVCCVFLYQTCFTRGSQLVPAGLSSMLASTDICWAYLFQQLLFQERPSALSLAGMACVVLAIVLLGAEKAVLAVRAAAGRRAAAAAAGRASTPTTPAREKNDSSWRSAGTNQSLDSQRQLSAPWLCQAA